MTDEEAERVLETLGRLTLPDPDPDPLISTTFRTFPEDFAIWYAEALKAHLEEKARSKEEY